MTMENDITNGSCKTSGTVQNIKRKAFLRTGGNGINNSGFRVIRLKLPLMIVQMKNMGFLDAPVYQPDFGRITCIIS